MKRMMRMFKELYTVSDEEFEAVLTMIIKE